MRKTTVIREISHPDSFDANDIARAALPYAEGYRLSDIQPYLDKAKKLGRPYILVTYSGILEGIHSRSGERAIPKRVFSLYLLGNSYHDSNEQK
jgi:hypothetical protein